MRSYLAHYGVKGMKWGVRKDSVKETLRKNRGTLDSTASQIGTSLGQSTRKALTSSLKDRDKKRNKKYKEKEDLSKYSDDDLRKMVNRLNMEAQYKKLKYPSPENSVSAGKELVYDIIGTAGSATVTAAATIGVKMLVDHLLESR